MLRRRSAAISAALIFCPLSARTFATVAVEQVEAYFQQPNGVSGYAPIDFGGTTSLTVQGNGWGGHYDGLTFHADTASGTTQTQSDHANEVGDLIYGSGTVAYAGGFVTDIYNISADQFFNVVIAPQGASGIGPVPGTFAGNSKVINNSYVAYENTDDAYLDDNRRLDFMINQADVVWVAAAVTGGVNFAQQQELAWSNFNGLAVTGLQNSNQNFDPAGSPGKMHADLSLPTRDGSDATGTVSGYAAALWGNAQNAGQIDAQHSFVVRSLLMAGADKNYTHPASNSSTGALDPVNGAGAPDYDSSLSILQAGEKTLLTVSGTNTVTGTPSTTQKGWASANVSAGQKSVVLFNSSNAITSLTASLNWNVTSSQPNSGQINTSTGALIFPNLTLDVRAVTFNPGTGAYTLGASQGTLFQSAITGDNVQFLWANTGLAAGTYAFLIDGDSTYSPTVGFSYSLAGSFASRWNSSAGSSWGTATNWTNGIPNGQAAQANLMSAPGLTTAGVITLDGDRTVGQLTFNNSNGYTISSGSSGTLTIDDTGDSTGTATPTITVLAGSHTISAPVNLVNGVTVNTSAATMLTVAGAISDSGTLIKSGSGQLTFGASTSSGILVRTLPININAGTVALAPAAFIANRQLLISSSLSIAGSTNNWAGKLDLNNNDLDVPGGSLATITNQLKQGYNGGGWNSANGIVSSSAASDPTRLTTLGVIQNNQSGTAVFTASNTFDGTTPGAADILVKYTYYGDANLDGKVDASDYSLIDSGFITHATGWLNGDFNYDGVVNGSDYTLIDNAFNRQGAQLSVEVAESTAQIANPSTVPEPTPFCTLAIAAMALLGRRRLCR